MEINTTYMHIQPYFMGFFQETLSLQIKI